MGRVRPEQGLANRGKGGAAASSSMPSKPKINKAKASAGKPTKKDKFAKPKHLKRKLEALVPDDPRHQQVLGELKTYTHQKEEYLVGKNPDRPVTKMTVPSSGQQRTMKEQPAVDILPEPKPEPKPVQSADDNKEASDTKPTRQRGQRRRGRKDTSSLDAVDKPATEAPAKPLASDRDKDTESEPPVPKSDQKTLTREPKRRSIKRQGDPRYCVGRRPISDYEVGSTHNGTVVYAKPFGVFIDIGCHSDAFCHVSRLSDDFVENPEAMFNPGDAITGVRVVETDRLKKRITVSLQSEKRIEDEKKSLESRLERKSKRRTSQPVRRSMGSGEKKQKTTQGTRKGNSSTAEDCQSSQKTRHPVQSPAEGGTDQTKEFKRQQKLERRAARREQQQVDG